MQSAVSVSAATAVVRRKKLEMQHSLKRMYGSVAEVYFEVWYDECCAYYKSTRQIIEDAHAYRKIELSFRAHRLRRVRDEAYAELKWLKMQLSTAVAHSQGLEYAALRE
jgi:aminopeptidase N